MTHYEQVLMALHVASKPLQRKDFHEIIIIDDAVLGQILNTMTKRKLIVRVKYPNSHAFYWFIDRVSPEGIIPNWDPTYKQWKINSNHGVKDQSA
jgi:hypothetical protein